jgi:hypothetical protein
VYKGQLVQELLVLQELAAMAPPELQVFKGQPVLVQPALREPPAHKAQQACLVQQVLVPQVLRELARLDLPE